MCVCVWGGWVCDRELIDNNEPYKPLLLGVLENGAKDIAREGSCTFQVNTINIYQNGKLWKGESTFSQCLQKRIDTSKRKKVCMFPNRRIFFLAGDML